MKRLTLWLTMAALTLSAWAQTPSAVMPKSRAAHTVQLKAPKKAAEQRDENGVIIAPASGEEVTFERTGGGVLLLSGFSTSEGVQSGTSKFVFCDDGTVYWNHPLCDALESQHIELTDTWVKGKLEGETITFAPGQPISCGTRPPYTPYVLYMGDFNTDELTAYPVKDEPIVLKFTRGGKVLELQNSSKLHLLGVFSSSTGYSVGSHWDYATSYTRDTTGEHDPAVTLPAGVPTTKYISNGYDATMIYDSEVEASYPIGNVTFSSQLGFDGNDAYLSNFSFYGIDHWIKGKRQADGSIVFPKEQYIFTTKEDHYDLYVYALPHGSTNAADACDLVLTYDAATKDYVSGQDLFINYEKMGSKLDKAECLENFRLVSYNDVAPAPIYSAPKGYRQISYERHGKCFNSMTGWWDADEVPDYQIQIAYNPNGKDVYMLSPIGAAELDYWVKGTIEDDGKLHVPTQQWIQQDPDYGNLRTGVFGIKWVNKSRVQYTYEWIPDIKEVTFSIDDDGFLTLDPLAADDQDGVMPPLYTYGMVRGTDEYSMAGLMDAYSIYVPIEGSETIIGEGEDPDQPIVDPDDEDEKVDISQLCPGEEHNDFGIITAPGTGTEFTYSRAGGNYAYVANNIDEGTQSGVIHLVETEDGYIFMQQPLSTYSKAYAATAWIKGVKKDGQYIFPEGQVINFDAYWESALVVCMGEYDSTDGTFMPDHQRNIVFEISDDGNTLTLQNTSNAKPLALFYADDDAWVGYGDYNTVLTYKSGGLVEEKVEPNWKTERINYTLTAIDIDPIEGGFKGFNAVLAFEGDDVYLGNFSYWLDYYHDETGKYIWIKGNKRADGSLFFPREQYLYSFEQMGDNWDLFFYGCTEPVEGAYSPSDLVFTYDEANERYFAQQDILITFGRITTSIPRAEQLTGAVLVRDKNEGTRPYIIDEQPEGELRSYSRSGFAFEFMNGGIYESNQTGKDIEFVFSPDGKTVFMHTPISGAITSNGINTADSWVAGTLDENGNIFVPLNQWISYDDELGYGARTGAFVYTEDDGTSGYMLVQNLIAFTFTFNPADGSYSLDRLEGIDYTTPAPRIIYGAYWTNDYTWTGLGDFDSVYTPNFPWTPDNEGIDTITADRNSETYYDFLGRVARPTENVLLIQQGRKMIVK